MVAFNNWWIYPTLMNQMYAVQTGEMITLFWRIYKVNATCILMIVLFPNHWILYLYDVLFTDSNFEALFIVG